MPQVELRAVCDPVVTARQRFEDEHSEVEVVDSFAKLLDAGIDLVYLASPQQYHAPQACAALEADIHVLSEVPPAVSLEQAHALVAAARRSTALYMVSENYNYTRPNMIVGEMVRAGVFGDLYYGEADYLHELRALHFDESGQRTWQGHWQVGRNAFTYPTHCLGPLLSWFDTRLVSVSCAGTGRHTEHAIEDTLVLLGRTATGALVKLRLDMLSRRPSELFYVALQGTNGAYEASRGPSDYPRVYLHGRSQPDRWEPLDAYADQFYRPEHRRLAASWGSALAPLRDFVDTILSGGTSPIDVYRALDMTLPGIISEQSLASAGQWVPVPDPRFFTAGIGQDIGPEWPLA